uniref:Uncharacterized protein n=1 Tax=Oryza glumipatula TaxID=40148 RepID=A0A0D9Y2C3_9ORYZ
MTTSKKGTEETMGNNQMIIHQSRWNPKNHPSMKKVVNMLTGSLQSLAMPPKPFVSSLGHPRPQI